MQIETSGKFSSDYSPSKVDLYEYYLGFIKRHNFEYFSLFSLPNSENGKFSELSMLSNWPHYIARLHDQIDMWQNFPTIENQKNSSQPGHYEFDYHAVEGYSDRQLRILQLIKNSGIAHSIGQKICSNTGKLGIVTFSARSMPEKIPDLEAVIEYTNRVFDQIVGIEQDKSELPTRLSKREHECLLWTSQGKTSYEIGMILGLSENTINNYLVAVGRKLRAVNRPHMVRIAMLAGIIE